MLYQQTKNPRLMSSLWMVQLWYMPCHLRGKTFESYATLDFLPRIQTYSNKYDMTHLVFDVYSPPSLKADNRSKRGEGGRRKVTKKNTVPSIRRNFFRHCDIMMELFQLFTEMIAQMSAPNLLTVTKGLAVLSTHEIGLHGLDNCSHEEADNRIFVHAKYSTEHGDKAIMTLQWRHNGHDSGSNHQSHDCLLNRYSGTDQRKHQSCVSLAFVRGIPRTKGQ